MSLWRIAWRFLWNRALVSVLTLLGVALGAALISTVLTLRRETERTFIRESSQFDLVVGAKGSPLQLVLSSIYHLDVPTGNIPYSRYEALRNDRRVAAAIPVGLGDNYAGFRIVGTTPEIFELQARDEDAAHTGPRMRLASGMTFEMPFDVVLGAETARQTGLQLGEQFFGSHGLVAGAEDDTHEEFPYTVKGILAPAGNSTDRAIFTALESVWAMHEHQEEEDEDHAEESEAEREVTAVLVQLQMPGMRMWLARDINKQTESMAAIPINEMLRLYQQVLAPIQRALLAVAYIVVIVAALTVLTTLYQSSERRRRDMAILRALGALPRQIFFLLLIEAFFLTFMGLGAGGLLGHALISASSFYLRQSTGLVLSGWTIDLLELKALLAVAIAGMLAGLVPALMAYRRSPAVDLAAN